MQKKVCGQLSGLIKHILRVFFQESLSFSTGVRCPVGGSSELFVVKSELGCTIQDAKAHKETEDVKGSGGTKMCNFCKNMTQGIEGLSEDDYFKDYRRAFPCSFDLHTSESYKEMVTLLNEEAPVMTNAKFQRLQQCLGLAGVQGVLSGSFHHWA